MTLLGSWAIKGRCPICGADGASCGGPSSSHPVDEPITGPVGTRGATGRTIDEAIEAFLDPSGATEAQTVADNDTDLIIARDGRGNTFQMTRKDARLAGYTPLGATAAEGQPEPGLPAAGDVEQQATADADAKAAKTSLNKARTSAGDK